MTTALKIEVNKLDIHISVLSSETVYQTTAMAVLAEG